LLSGIGGAALTGGHHLKVQPSAAWEVEHEADLPMMFHIQGRLEALTVNVLY
jgi:hypothetical protein